MKMTRRLFANHPAEHMSKEDQVHFHAVLNKSINSLYHIYGLNDIPDPALEGMCIILLQRASDFCEAVIKYSY